MQRKTPKMNGPQERRVFRPLFSNHTVRVCLLALALWGAGGVWMALAAPAGGMPATRGFHWQAFLAPFHSVILHYPIGFVTIVCMLEAAAFWRERWDLRRAIGIIMVLSAMSAVLAAGLGWLRATGGDYNPVMLERHRWSGTAVTLLTILTAGVYFIAYGKAHSRAWVMVYRAGLVSSLITLVIAGHMGGNLTHGANYLTENAPRFLRRLLGETPGVVPPAPTGFYAQKIAPIFEAKCVQCHGPDKQKGKYRLDRPEYVLKPGGATRAPVKPGDPLQSELVRRVTLPRGHDEAMPPEGKQALTGDEVLLLMDWIYHGASFDQ